MENLSLNIDPYTYTGSALVVGLILVNELSPLEQASIGNWLQLIGLTIQTYASQKTLVDSYNKTGPSDDLDVIKRAIDEINKQIDILKSNRSCNEI